MSNEHLKLEILSIGTELLMGNVIDTNSSFFANECTKMGYVINHHQTVGDNYKRLEEAMRLALSRSDVVITSGGLGPTSDDITKEVAAKVFEMELAINEDAKNHIKKYFEKTGRVCSTKTEFKTAQIPKGAMTINNDNGTALGVIMQKNDKTMILFPGPPIEVNSIYNNGVKSFLEKLSKNKLTSITLKLVDIGETVASERIKTLIDNQTNPTIAPYAKTGEMHFRVTYSGDNLSELYKVVDEIKKILGKYIYTEREDENLQQVVFNLLKEKNMKLSIAESCTGGMVAEMFTGISGASTCFNGSFVTYTDEMKQKILNVNCVTLKNFTAISSEVALEMAIGALSLANSDIAVSITGNAGPNASCNKDVGLVYIAVATREKQVVNEFHFSGDRDKIRLLSANNAFNLVRKLLIGMI